MLIGIRSLDGVLNAGYGEMRALASTEYREVLPNSGNAIVTARTTTIGRWYREEDGKEKNERKGI